MDQKQISRFIALLIVLCAQRVCCGGIDAWTMNARLGRGINLGNALEAPVEGQWGVTLREEYFQIIKDGGFNCVRIPIKWSAHASTTAPYTIDQAFFTRVDWAVNGALSRGLAAVINIHHYDELMTSPSRLNQERFIALWRQIAERYKDYPDDLVFELLNEPHGSLTYQIWNELLVEAINTIRRTNPNRNIVVGATGWNGKWELVNRLQLPADDRHIIATFHHYSPFNFTHQGAEWVDGSTAWLGTKWQGTPEETRAITKEFDDICSWSRSQNRPVFMGEFGAYSKADMESRIGWTTTSAREAEARSFSWAYWEFCSGFGAYNDKTGKWNELHRALVPNAVPESLIRNYEFDFGTDHWWVRTQDGGVAAIADVTGANLSGPNSLKVTITNGGPKYESVLVGQSNIGLLNGATYRISFMAKVDGRLPRTIQTRLQRRNNEQLTYWQQQQTVTSSPNVFSYLLQSAATDTDVELCFLLGRSSAVVYIDKVIMREAWDCREIIETGLRLPGDLGGPDGVADCYVDSFDLRVISSEWLKDNSPADVSGPQGAADGTVSFYDFLTIAEEWLECNNLADLRCDVRQ